MVTKNMLEAKLADFVNSTPENTISEAIARSPECVGLTMFKPPILNISDANDPIFSELLNPEIIGPHLMTPDVWLPGAKSVISFMLPYTDRVRTSNKQDFSWPSTEWMHGRIEGQAMVGATSEALVSILKQEGFNAMSPLTDPRLGPKFHFEDDTAPNPLPRYASRWSERHAAFIAGLGTFGLSRGLITRKGMAGRLGSVITDAPFDPDPREYTDIHEYCTRCGACIKNCPVDAISFEHGKDNTICASFIDKILEAEGGTYYGCGKCQCGVPCETQIPKK